MLAKIAILTGCLLSFATAEVPMARVEGGSYHRPLEKNGATREVASFLLDVRQVTNAEFLKFVTEHPEWQRSKVDRLFADAGYLAHWAGDTELGPMAPPDAPVIRVSWFAARAYLKQHGKRLPTLDEWEYAARADETQTDASGQPQHRQRILDWYARPTPPVLPTADSMPPDVRGIKGMHSLVWEWTSNFVASMSGGESRSDGSPDGPMFCGGAATDPNQATEYADYMRTAFRSSLQGDFCLPGLGFRGAKDAESPNRSKP